MPIRFKCSNCGQTLSVSRKKAGSEATCPQCVTRIRIPSLPPDAPPEPEVSVPADPPVAAPPAPPVKSVAEAAQLSPIAPPASVSNPGVSENLAPPPVVEEEEVWGGLRPEEDLNLHSPTKSTAWDKHPNPWRNDEEEEEEFQLKSPLPPESALDMTPMVDVVMLLLIFFMITASFATQKSLESSPPPPDEEGRSTIAASADEVREDSVVVTVDESNKLYVDDVPVAGTEELAEVLRTKMRAERKTDMLIEADRKASHGMVVAVTDVGIDVQMQHIRRASRKSD